MTESSARDLGIRSHLDALLATVGPVHDLRVLDIGCGEGHLVRALAEQGAHVTGYDPFIAETPLTEQGAGSYRLANAPADALPEPDHEADLVLFVFSLHHVPGARLESALAEARRVLRPSGRLYVAEPLAQGPHQYIIELFHDETAVRKGAADALARFAQLSRFRLLCRAHDRQHALQRLQRGGRAGPGSAPALRGDARCARRQVRSARPHRLLRPGGLKQRGHIEPRHSGAE
jgi:ubiquinone/menaquinone biosynthesis C-methylase UbiE